MRANLKTSKPCAGCMPSDNNESNIFQQNFTLEFEATKMLIVM
jgi:hypothetical protein